MAKAAIDIGSNSLLLTVVDDAGAVLHDEARVVGLGRGLGDRGLFRPDRLAAAEAALLDYLAIARTHGIEPWAIRAVATSAARRSMNAATWLSKLQRTHGVRVRIVSGDEEARLTWLGSRRDLDLPDAAVLVVDLGGGSTELSLGHGEQIESQVSLELGSVRLTEQFLCGRDGSLEVADAAGLAALRKHVDIEIDRVHLDPAPQVVIGVAGTVTTLATMHLDLQRYDGEAVHGSVMTREVLARFIDRLLAADSDGRRAMVPAAPDRADYLLAGAVILDRVLTVSSCRELIVSDRGLRFGLLD